MTPQGASVFIQNRGSYLKRYSTAINPLFKNREVFYAALYRQTTAEEYTE